MMVTWMRGVSLKDRRSSLELLDCMGIVCICQRMRRCWLCWFGHVERKSGDDWVSKCRDLVVEGARGVSRGKKKLFEWVANDMGELGRKRGDAMDRAVWRGGILTNHPTRACAE